MSEFKGTPAPWKLGDEKYYNGNKAFEIHYGNDGECVSEVVHRVEDAQLIAHAPEMLEMLIEIKNKLGTTFEKEKSEIEQLIQKATTPCETK